MLKSRLPLIVAELPARVDAAIGASAELVAAYARNRVPVGAPDVHLRDAIHVDREDMGSYYVVAGDTDVFYGHMVEFGTSHSAPHPFLIPAAEDARPAVVASVRKALRGRL